MDERDEQEQEFHQLAKSLDLTPKQLRQHLAALGWSMLKEATDVNFLEMQLGGGEPKSVDVLALTAKNLLPLSAELPTEQQEVAEPGPGYLYVLYDGKTKLSKFGCAKSVEQRRRVTLGPNGRILANVLNAQVNDMLAAERKCRGHFAASCKDGEWFAAELEDIIAYICREVDWERLFTESMVRMDQYIEACRVRDMTMARFALTGPNFPVPEF